MVNILNKEADRRITDAIREAERHTTGEIRVHIRQRSPDDILGEAKKIFRKLRMHRTRFRNGVLIFIAPESQAFAIFGDEGMDAKVGGDFWAKTRDIMKEHFQAGRFEEGIAAGVRSAGGQLKIHFPSANGGRNELSDHVTHD